MKIVAIIPARMASSRFPGKPLAPIQGISMVEHVRRRTELCPFIDLVLVATCDEEIDAEVRQFGGKVVMTSPTHKRGTERVAEAALTLTMDIVINVQGDMPFVRREMLEALVAPLLADSALVCTDLMSPIDDDEDYNSENVVKVVFDKDSNALYYSRDPIPSLRKAPAGTKVPKFKQLGITAFRRDFLQKFIELPPHPLEIIESVDMMRALENGYRIRMVETAVWTIGVDVPADLTKADEVMQRDPLYPKYK